jgi:hypothetical protein
VLDELSRHLSAGNENIRRGYEIAAIRDLAQIKVAALDNYRDLQAIVRELLGALEHVQTCQDCGDRAWLDCPAGARVCELIARVKASVAD